MSLLSYEASQSMLELLSVGTLRYEKLPLSETLGRILYEDVVAQYNDPRFPTASMDGYAVKHADLALGRLKVLGDNPAGSHEERTIEEGESIKTFTGSMMPKGSDTLIQIENVSREGDEIVINEAVVFGSSVRPVGEGFRSGDILIKKGTKIGFAQIGVMAALNMVMVKVAQKPRVGVVSTGSEILDLGEQSTNPAQIRSSNNYTLAALFAQAGAQSLQLGVVGDDKTQIIKSFENALASCDIVVTTGGVSVGDYDFVKDIVPRLGAEVVFKGVAIKPGRHIMLAKKDEKFIVSLPGFAYSSTVTAVLYVLPLISKMLGREEAYRIVEAKLQERFEKRSKFTEFTPCNALFDSGGYEVDFQDKRVGSSAILTNLLNDAALMISGEEDAVLEIGTSVNVILLDSF